MFPIKYLLGSITLATSLLVASINGVEAQRTSAMIAQFDLGPGVAAQNVNLDVSNLLRFKSNAAMKPFEKLLTKFARVDKSICDAAADFRLVTVYRSWEGSTADDPGVAAALEAARSLYGIRKAVCETGLAGTQVPSPCKKLLPVITSNMSQKQMIAFELELAQSNGVSACLQRFQEHHYFWTSYSNNRQDANSIFHLLRSDIELHSMVMIFRDFQSSWGDFREDLDSMHTSTASWFDEASRKAQSLFDSQNETLTGLNDGVENATSMILHRLELAESMLIENEIAMLDLLNKTDSDLSSIAKEADLVSQGILRMKTAITDIHTSAALETVTFTQLQIDRVAELYNTIEMKLSELTVPIDDISSSLSIVSTEMKSFEELQTELMSRVEQQYHLAGLVLEKQHSIIEAVEYVHEMLAQASSKMEDLSTAASAVTYIFSLVQQYDHIILAVCIYIALSLALAPLGGVIIPQQIVTDIKATYWAAQAGLFLWRKLDIRGKLSSAERLVAATGNVSVYRLVFGLSILLVLIVIAGLIVSFSSSGQAVESKADVEKAEGLDVQRPRVFLCDSQRQRLESIPRRSRHGTAPPGL